MGDAQVIEGSCKNGHVRTEQNTSFVKDRARSRVRIRCLDCKRANKPELYTGKGSDYSAKLKYDAMLDRHDDIEDLLRFGAEFAEILERSGYANWNQMRRSLRHADRQDLIEKLQRRRGAQIAKAQGATKIRGNRKGVTPDTAHKLPTNTELDTFAWNS